MCVVYCNHPTSVHEVWSVPTTHSHIPLYAFNKYNFMITLMYINGGIMTLNMNYWGENNPLTGIIQCWPLGISFSVPLGVHLRMRHLGPSSTIANTDHICDIGLEARTIAETLLGRATSHEVKLANVSVNHNQKHSVRLQHTAFASESDLTDSRGVDFVLRGKHRSCQGLRQQAAAYWWGVGILTEGRTAVVCHSAG